MKKEETKATPIKKSDRPEPITKDSAKKQTAESVKGTSTKTSAGATSEPEQLGEKENVAIDPSSQALNQGTTKLNDGSSAGGYNATEK